MIVAKTALKKIPDKCSKCSFGCTRYNIGRVDYKCCVLVNKEIVKQFVTEKNNWVYVKPEWCPLTQIKLRSK